MVQRTCSAAAAAPSRRSPWSPATRDTLKPWSPTSPRSPCAEKARAEIDDVYDTYCNKGIGAAWQRFSTFSGIEMRTQGEGATPQAPSAEAVATSERFFRHGLLPIALYQPDCSALQSTPVRVVVAGGTTSKDQFAQRTAVALAERLGTRLIDFPGGHAGFASDPEDFAAVLRRSL
jgi:hypothetical protein